MNVMTSVTPPAREGRDSCWAPSKGCAKVSAGGNPRLAPCARSLPSGTRLIIILLPLPTQQLPHRPLHSRPLSGGPQPLPQLPPRDGHREPVPPLLTQPLQLLCHPSSSSLPRLGYLIMQRVRPVEFRDGQFPQVLVQSRAPKLALGHQRCNGFVQGVTVDDGG